MIMESKSPEEKKELDQVGKGDDYKQVDGKFLNSVWWTQREAWPN